MTRNKDLGEITIHDSTNSRLVRKADSVVDSIIDQFLERAEGGRGKYGVDLDRNDLSLLEWIEHAKQEHMDAILYLEKIKVLIGGKE